MRVIKRQTLQVFWEAHRDVEGDLKAWHSEAKQAEWKTPADIKRRFGSSDILPGNRVVFNIKGNHYRLVVKIHYNVGVVYIRFIGTHADYDKIDAETI